MDISEKSSQKQLETQDSIFLWRVSSFASARYLPSPAIWDWRYTKLPKWHRRISFQGRPHPLPAHLYSSLQPFKSPTLPLVSSAGFSPTANPGLQLLFPYPVNLSIHCSAFQILFHNTANTRYKSSPSKVFTSPRFYYLPKLYPVINLLSCEFSDTFQHGLISARFSSPPLPEAQGQGHFLNYCFYIPKWTG